MDGKPYGWDVLYYRNGVVVYDGEWLNDDPLEKRIEITSATIVTPLNPSSQVFRSRRPFLSPVLIQQADTLSELLPIAWVVLMSPHFLFGRFRNLLQLLGAVFSLFADPLTILIAAVLSFRLLASDSL